MKWNMRMRIGQLGRKIDFEKCQSSGEVEERRRRRMKGKDDRAGIRERLREEAGRQCSGREDRVGWTYLF